MRHTLLRLLSSIMAFAALSVIAYGQGANSSLSGTVSDPNGGVIAGANVTVKNAATGEEYKAVTANNGTFAVATLAAGTYTVTVSASGFKQAVVTDVKLDAGVPGAVKVPLEIGAATETVTIQGGGEVVQTQSANIATTLQVTQIASLPLVSRNPLNFVVLLPGVNTTTTNRNSTINGLPQSSIDITLDGINIQDNFNKTTDGFFVRVSPSLDSVQEVTVSTATPEASGGGMGAVSIKFVTRSGSNEFHGGLYEYHRNPWLNSAYWFNNRNVAPYDVQAAKTCVNGTNTRTGALGPTTVALAANEKLYDPETCQATRDRVLLNQYGGRFGGPITIPKLFDGRNKAFFFVNFEASNQPSQVSRQRTIMSPQAQAGTFQYGTGTVRTVNVLTLAAANGQTATIDPVIGKLLSDIRSATTGTGGIEQLADLNIQRFSYNPTGSSTAKRPTVRFDFNVSDKHHVETSWTYTDQRGGPDFLNSVEPRFPGFPNQGSQPADRYTGAAALRSTLTPTLVNEVRGGLSGGPSRFNPTASAADFTSSGVANQAGFNLNISAFGTTAITTATATSAPSRRNPKFTDISDTVTWTRGAHGLTFGGKFTFVTLTFNQQTLVPTINFGVDTADPANAMFNTTNFPSASNTDLAQARALYAVLTGRVTAINANIRLTEEGKYVYLGNAFERSRQKELGIFAQDSWRFRPNVTLNYGLRWEVAGSIIPLNSSYSTLSFSDLYGVSGVGNLFKPGTLTGRVPQFVQVKAGDKAYNTDYKNFAPNFGFAWSPNVKGGWLGRLVGESGQTVIRGGYSIAYSRRGIGELRGIQAANPGITLTTNRDQATGNLTGGTLGGFPLLLRETSRLGPPSFVTTPTYPFTAPITSSGNLFDPNIKAPYTQSYSLGVQREINKDMAIEVRYVGNRFLRQWTTYDLNDTEANILENGIFNEFKLAQANLQANIVAGRGNTFKYSGPNTGTSPLPITLAYFAGAPGGVKPDPNNTNNYTSTNFTSTTFTNNLALFSPAPATFAGNLSSDAGRRANAIAAGLPANFILTNPDLRGGAAFTGNGGYTRYDGMQVELRRRMSKGFLVQGNYTFAKSFASSRISYRVPRINSLGDTLQHAFKVNWIYELPIGKGKMFFGNSGGVVDRLIGGWEFDGTGRVQSGRLFDFGNVRLVGMTRKDLQKAFGLYFNNDARDIRVLPQDIIDNTIRAFNVSATSVTKTATQDPGYSGLAPTGRYIAPANSNLGCIQVAGNECAPTSVVVTGPMFTRFDLSAVKKFKVTERFNFELRVEMLNAFNHINFNATTCASNSATCGQVTSAYTDPSNTQDPGGRLGQIVLRFNF